MSDITHMVLKIGSQVYYMCNVHIIPKSRKLTEKKRYVNCYNCLVTLKSRGKLK